jgi:MYXO-CTERM domain-containing protein
MANTAAGFGQVAWYGDAPLSAAFPDGTFGVEDGGQGSVVLTRAVPGERALCARMTVSARDWRPQIIEFLNPVNNRIVHKLAFSAYASYPGGIRFPRRILSEQLDDRGRAQVVDEWQIVSASFNKPGDTADLDRGLPEGTVVDDSRFPSRTAHYRAKPGGVLPTDEMVKDIDRFEAPDTPDSRMGPPGVGPAMAWIGLLGMLAVTLVRRRRTFVESTQGPAPPCSPKGPQEYGSWPRR